MKAGDPFREGVVIENTAAEPCIQSFQRSPVGPAGAGGDGGLNQADGGWADAGEVRMERGCGWPGGKVTSDGEVLDHGSAVAHLEAWAPEDK